MWSGLPWRNILFIKTLCSEFEIEKGEEGCIATTRAIEDRKGYTLTKSKQIVANGLTKSACQEGGSVTTQQRSTYLEGERYSLLNYVWRPVFTWSSLL